MTALDGIADHGLYIFGYGSLVSAESVSRTLKRKIDRQQMPIGLLHEYSRDWEIRVPIIFEDGYACNGLFLDIAPQRGALINGVLIPVTEAELGMLMRREAQYDAVEVADLVQSSVPSGASIIAFQGRPEFRRDTAQMPSFRPRIYRALVEAAVSTRGEDFLAQFHATTRRISGVEYEGNYRFADLAQELATRPPLH